MTPERTRRIRAGGTYLVAAILAVGMCTAINAFTIAVLIDAMVSPTPGLSENATQILTGWGGGIIGVIGAVVGYQAGTNNAIEQNAQAGALGQLAGTSRMLNSGAVAADTPTNDSLPGLGSRGG